jgi:hypothetical protein
MQFNDSSNVQMRNELVQDSTTRFITRLVDAVKPMATEPPFDYRLQQKIKPFLKPGETSVQEVVARTGISPQSLRDWDHKRISAFIRQAELNNANDGF